MEANQTTQPTMNALSTLSTFFAKVYVPPYSGNLLAISATLNAVSKAMIPLSAKANTADGPVAA